MLFFSLEFQDLKESTAQNCTKWLQSEYVNIPIIQKVIRLN